MKSLKRGMAKRGILIGAIALAWLCGAAAADFRSVKTVYLLPMSNGLDQYLASRLASESVLQVVTDPKKADAVLTDHVGESFEKSLDDLYGSTTPAKDKDSDDNSETTSFARVGGAIRARGTYFLVDRNSRDVLWSGQEVPKDSSPKETRRIAARIADRLAKALGTKNAANEK